MTTLGSKISNTPKKKKTKKQQFFSFFYTFGVKEGALERLHESARKQVRRGLEDS